MNDLGIYLLGLLVFDLLVVGPLTGWLARQKNRPFSEGLIVGIVLGLIGFLLIAVAPRRTTPGRGLSPVAWLLVIVIAILLVWLAAGTPGLS